MARKKVTKKRVLKGPTKVTLTPIQEIADLRRQATELLQKAERISLDNDLVFIYTYDALKIPANDDAHDPSDYISSDWQSSSC